MLTPPMALIRTIRLWIKKCGITAMAKKSRIQKGRNPRKNSRKTYSIKLEVLEHEAPKVSCNKGTHGDKVVHSEKVELEAPKRHNDKVELRAPKQKLKVWKNDKESLKIRDAASNEVRCVKPNKAGPMDPIVHNESHETAPRVATNRILHGERKTPNTTTNKMIDEQGMVEHKDDKDMQKSKDAMHKEIKYV
jgi:hypothetical protein